MNSSMRRLLGGSTCILRFYATRTRKPKSFSPSTPSPSPSPPSSPRPPHIPFQPKLANAVNLIGQVDAPVQFHTSPDGKTWASTLITRPYLSIPIIFEGDLAHTAFSHLKLNDFVHIAGQLSTDPPHQNHQSDLQVVVQTLNFVQGYSQLDNVSAISTHKVVPFSADEKNVTNPSWKVVHGKKSQEHDIDKSWKDLLDNPVEWWDVRSAKENPKGAAFERKADGELLFVNSSTPKWLLEKLELMTIDLKPEPKPSISGAKKDSDSSLGSWTDLLNDPKKWHDFRDVKQKRLVNPKHPDFKHKDSGAALWLNGAPSWVFPKLKGLEFKIGVTRSKKPICSKDDIWMDLAINPTKWWDNRLDKRNEKSPDFKNKETGEGLWLNDSPSWVISKLPPLKSKQGAETGRRM